MTALDLLVRGRTVFADGRLVGEPAARLVTLRLRRESRLGEAITFIPADQAAVAEVRALVAAAP